MSYSIGANIVPRSCLDDLNKLLKLVNPIARDMPWTYWRNIMQSGNQLITCFDDKRNCVIGMTTVAPIIIPSGCFADIYDTAVFAEYADTPVTSSMLCAAEKLIKDANLILI